MKEQFAPGCVISKEIKQAFKSGYLTEKYILNGHTFPSYDLAVEYAAQNNWRISNTQKIGIGIYLLTVSSI